MKDSRVEEGAGGGRRAGKVEILEIGMEQNDVICIHGYVRMSPTVMHNYNALIAHRKHQQHTLAHTVQVLSQHW